jgi:aryl-alcohol dehydrogenase-like predicted oxidoreductase
MEQHRSQLEANEASCQQLSDQPADITLAWLLQQRRRHASDHRATHRGVADRESRALKMALSDETLRQLDEIW